MEDESHGKPNSSGSTSLHRHMDSHHIQVNTPGQLHTSLHSVDSFQMIDADGSRCSLFCSTSYYLSPRASPTQTHTRTYWRTFTHTTAPMYGQQTWVWFRFVDILSGLESGLLWKPRISLDTRAFSPCWMGYGYRIEFSVTLAYSCRQTRSDGETQQEHTPMSVHI